MCPQPAASLITLTSSTRFRSDAYEQYYINKLTSDWDREKFENLLIFGFLGVKLHFHNF